MQRNNPTLQVYVSKAAAILVNIHNKVGLGRDYHRDKSASVSLTTVNMAQSRSVRTMESTRVLSKCSVKHICGVPYQLESNVHPIFMGSK